MEVENKRSDFTAAWNSLSSLYLTKFSYLGELCSENSFVASADKWITQGLL